MFLLGVLKGDRLCDNIQCGKYFKWIYPNGRDHEANDEVQVVTMLIEEHLNVCCPCSHCKKQNYFSICTD